MQTITGADQCGQWFDLELSVQKTIHYINEAGKAGCKLVGFPEVCTYAPLSSRTLSGWLLITVLV